MIRQIKTNRSLAGTVLAIALACLFTGTAKAATPAWHVLPATAPTHLPPATEEIQQVAVDASGGTFVLALEGQSTGALAFNVGRRPLEAALDSLPYVSGSGGDVTVTGGPGNAGAETPYMVKFGGALAGRDIPEMTADSAALQGGAATATVTTVAESSELFEGGRLVVAVTNIGGAASTNETPISVAIGPLPAGVTVRQFEENPFFGEWKCPAGSEGTVVTCTNPVSVAAGESTPTLKVPITIRGQIAQPTSTLPVTVSGGGATADTYDAPLVISSTPAGPGVAAVWAGAFDADGKPETQAGSHPYSAATAFLLNTVLAPDGKSILPAGSLRTANVSLPPGFLGNPLVTQKRCPQEALDVVEEGGGNSSPLCTAAASRVGELHPAVGDTFFGGASASFSNKSLRGPLYDDVPAFGTAAEFSANITQFGHVPLLGSIRSDQDFGVDLGTFNLNTVIKVYGNLAFIEGFPASALGKPFLRNPTDCSLTREESAMGRGPVAALQMNSWANPDPNAIEDEVPITQPVITGCRALTEAWVGKGPEPEQERPTFTFQPNTSQAATGTETAADLRIPQRGLTDPNRLGSSDLKKTVVTLPPGMTLNPSAANGLQSCSEAQVGYLGSGFPMPNPTHFSNAPVTCPEASRLGTVSVVSPLLDEPLEGTIYLAAQEENPFGSLLALYLVVESGRFGITLKLPGEVKPNPDTGQLTATFDNNPQLPFEDLNLHFRGGGPRSELATPALCGTYKTTGSLTPWSAESESPAEAAQIEEPGFQLTSGPGGSACATSAGSLPFSPSFEAGTTSTQAGAYAPLVIKVNRKDGEQELTRLDFTLPPGLTGKLAGIPYCSDAAIEDARRKTGKAELASPSCPSASDLGTADAGAGVGSEPIHVGGHVYLAGPYKGAPLSTVVITPAVAGPFDLGDVVVRAPLTIDPRTAQITAKTDELPHILKGIPLQLRSIAIKIDRHDFTLNPTSCNAMTVASKVSGLNGGSASPSSRFQVGGCRSLPFKPQLKLSVLGPTRRNAKPRLRAVLTAKPGEANIRRAQVNLPHSEFLEQNHIKTVCTRVQFSEGDGNGSACPKGSIYGKARAWTPLLDHPLEGNVYLRSNGGERQLPDLVAALDGQIDIALQGKVDSGPNHGIRNTFEIVPDAPVSRFVLAMNGGGKGLLVNSENLCSPQAKLNAIVRLAGQNGKVRQFKPTLRTDCKGKKAGKSSHR